LENYWNSKRERRLSKLPDCATNWCKTVSGNHELREGDPDCERDEYNDDVETIAHEAIPRWGLEMHIG
jgi:hypothetical protein